MTEPQYCSCGDDVSSILPSTHNGAVVGYYGSLTHVERESSCGEHQNLTLLYVKSACKTKSEYSGYRV